MPKPEEDEKSKKVEPQTIQEKLQEGSTEALKLAGQARTDSITLAGPDYADDLSGALLKHANATEEVYKNVQLALKKNQRQRSQTLRCGAGIQSSSAEENEGWAGQVHEGDVIAGASKSCSSQPQQHPRFAGILLIETHCGRCHCRCIQIVFIPISKTSYRFAGILLIETFLHSQLNNYSPLIGLHRKFGDKRQGCFCCSNMTEHQKCDYWDRRD